jgi:hypothetical protein
LTFGDLSQVQVKSSFLPKSKFFQLKFKFYSEPKNPIYLLLNLTFNKFSTQLDLGKLYFT